MATFLHHTSCSMCGSKDNRGVWDDGSEWCFGCQSYTPPKGQVIVQRHIDKRPKAEIYRKVNLPEDALPYLPQHAERWLDKYSLTKEELHDLAPLYSFEKDLLIFPIYAQGKVVMYQGRYFGDKPKHPKYLICGTKAVLHFLGPDSDVVTVTEDVVSAVKVAHASQTTVMPLWGSSLSLQIANRLAARFKQLNIWLDYDKAVESLKMRQIYAPLFQQCVSINTKLDPKEYNHEEISRLIEQAKAG